MAHWRDERDVLTAGPRRFCPQCGAGEPVADDQPLWPAGWSCRLCGSAIEISDDIPLLAPALVRSSSDMDPTLFESLARWENNNFWFAPRNRLITSLLDRYFPAAAAIMEIGCGNGFVLTAISALKPWRRVVASELHPQALSTARSRLGCRGEFVQMDARTIPVADVFDVIGAFDVLEHIDDDTGVLAAMHRALRPGGGVVLSVPQHPWLWSGTDEAARHKRRYKRCELENKVQAAGFRVLFSGSYTALLLPVMMVSRNAGKTERLQREFEISPFANSVLKAIQEAEVMLTLAGLRFPIGGSRVVVAAKK